MKFFKLMKGKIFVGSLLLISLAMVDYSFNKPTVINKYIATRMMSAPANNLFHDDNLYICVVDAYNQENKTTVAYTESLTTEQLNNITDLTCINKGISDTAGLEKMGALTKLSLAENNLSQLDITQNTELKELRISKNNIIDIDLSKNTNLTKLQLGKNKLEGLNLENNILLEYVDAADNKLTEITFGENYISTLYLSLNNFEQIDLSKLELLSRLELYSNKLTSLDISNNKNLGILVINNNQLTELDLKNNSKITSLSIGGGCSYTNGNGMTSAQMCGGNPLATLDVSNIPNLYSLAIESSNLKNLNLDNNTELNFLDVRNNELTELNLSNNTHLVTVQAIGNELTDIILPTESKIKTLVLSDNQLKSFDTKNQVALETLRVSKNPLIELDLEGAKNLKELEASETTLPSIDLRYNTNLTELVLSDGCELYQNGKYISGNLCDGGLLASLDVSANINLKELTAQEHQLTSINLNGATLLNNLKLGNNLLTEIDVSNNPDLTSLSAGNNKLTSLKLKGADKLENLNVWGNELTTIDVSSNAKLTSLSAASNELTSINLNGANKLQYLDVWSNKLSEIDVSNNPLMQTINAGYNQLISLNLKGAEQLTSLEVYSNNLTEVDLSDNIALTTLSIYNNNLQTLDISKNMKLSKLQAFQNQITHLDVRNNLELTDLRFDHNNLLELDLSNNDKLNYVVLSQNPFSKNIVMYVNDTITEINPLRLPNNAINNITSSNNDESVIFNDDAVTVNVPGNYQIDVNYNHSLSDSSHNDYQVNYNIYAIEATSDLYLIDAEDGYIYTGLETNEDTILNNIKINYGDKKIENHQLIITYDDEVVKTFDIVNYTSDIYDLTNDYIYVDTEDFNLTEINMNKGGKAIQDNQLIIRYNEDILATYDIVGINSEKYDLTKEYLYAGYETFTCDDISVTKGNYVCENNQVLIKYKDTILRAFDVITLGSEDYLIGTVSNENYIFIYNDLFDENKINITSASLEVSGDDYVKVVYNDEVIDEYTIVGVTSEVYDLSQEYIIIKNAEPSLSYVDYHNCGLALSAGGLGIIFEGVTIYQYNFVRYYSNVYDLTKDYIYIGTKSDKLVLTDIYAINAVKEYNNNQVILTFNDEILDTYDVVSISSEKYDLTKDYIYVGTGELDLQAITVINGEKEIIDNQLVITYGDEVLDTFDIVSVSSDTYDLEKEYIYLKNETIDLNQIMVSNGYASLTEDNYININYGDVVVDEYQIISLSSDVYDLTNKYINLKQDIFDLNNVNQINVNYTLDESAFTIVYNEEVVDKFDLIHYDSSSYNLRSDTLKINELNIQDFRNQITCINCEINIYNNDVLENHFDTNYQAKIMYEDLVLETYDLEYSLIGVELDKESIVLDLEVFNEYSLMPIYTPVYASNKNVTYDSSNEDVATVDENGLITAISKGSTIITVASEEGGYTDFVNVSVSDLISSEVYNISLENKYIYVGLEKNIDVILSNLNISPNADYVIEDNLLKINKNNELAEEFKIINLASDQYDLTKEYLYTKDNELNTGDIEVTYADKEIRENKLVISYNEDILATYDLVTVKSEKYDVSKEYLYEGINVLNVNDITVVNGSAFKEGNQLLIKYGDYLLDTYSIVSISSDSYDLTKDYIYVATDKLDVSKINVVNGTSDIQDNKLLIKYHEDVLDSYNIVSISSDQYDLTKDYIYLPGVDLKPDKIKVINGSIDVSDTKVVIKVGDDLVDEFTIAALVIFDPLKIKNDTTLSIGKPMSHAEFLTKIALLNITYKIYDPEGNELNTDIRLDNGYKIEVLYNEKAIDTLDIEAYYLQLDDKLIVSNNTFKEALGTTVKNILAKITTNGLVKIVNSSGKTLTEKDKVGTGSKVTITLGDKIEEYIIISTGDLTGDGEVKINDVAKLYQKIKNKVTLNEYETAAGDTTNDNAIKINDVAKLYQFLKGKISSL